MKHSRVLFRVVNFRSFLRNVHHAKYVLSKLDEALINRVWHINVNISKNTLTEQLYRLVWSNNPLDNLELLVVLDEDGGLLG